MWKNDLERVAVHVICLALPTAQATHGVLASSLGWRVGLATVVVQIIASSGKSYCRARG